MKTRIVMTLALLVVASPVQGQEWAKRMFQVHSRDFGTVARNAKVEYRFVFKNLYEEDVHIASALPSCHCTSVSIESPTVKSYQTGAIVAKFNTHTHRGKQGATITVRIDRPKGAIVLLHVGGYIRDDIDIQGGGADLGTVNVGTMAEETVIVRRRGRPDWRIVEIQSPNEYVSAEVVSVSRQYYDSICHVRVRLDPKAPAGRYREHIRLLTNDSYLREVPLLVEGMVLPTVSVTPAEMFLGGLLTDEQQTRQVVIRSETPFQVVGVTSDRGMVEAQLPTTSVGRPIHVIPLAISAGPRAGKLVDLVRFQTDIPGAEAQLPLTAFVKARPEEPSTNSERSLIRRQ